MARKFSFTLLLLSLFFIGLAQQRPDTIPVVMKNDLRSNYFLPRVQNTQLYRGGNILRNIPENIVTFRIKKMSYDPGLSDFYIFYGINQKGERIIIFDSDFDGDLKNETIYIFGQDASYKRDSVKQILEAISPTEIKYPGLPSIFLKPSVFNCCRRYDKAEDSIWHLELQTSYYRTGKFKLKDEPYELELSASYTPVFAKGLEFYLDKPDALFDKSPEKILSYRLKSTVYVGREEFVINSVSRYGDTVWIVHTGNVDSAFGSRVGLFAKNIQTETLKMKPFNLTSLRGKFVLLDFWGTWCGPCIELIPELVTLHGKYRDKVKFVSVAYDEKQNYKKLKKMIKSKRMNWIHLFTDEDVPDNISEQYEVDCYPTSILIDPQGKIVFRGCGTKNFPSLVSLLGSYFDLQ